jgi:ubiquinone/menaquinone biosynthesis C-methylase UbiE
MENMLWKNYWETVTDKMDEKNVHTQVLRTVNKQPISDELFSELLDFTTVNLEMKSGDVLLDLCCGNGIITDHLVSKCSFALGVDFSPKLINEINKRINSGKILGIVHDITNIQLKHNSFDKILMYAGIQYLTYKQTVKLFSSFYHWLKPKGIAYIADIPDESRMWNFFNSPERESAYFDGIQKEEPIIGNWFTMPFLEKLARRNNYAEYKTFNQPKEFINSHYRFDMTLRK